MYNKINERTLYEIKQESKIKQLGSDKDVKQVMNIIKRNFSNIRYAHSFDDVDERKLKQLFKKSSVQEFLKASESAGLYNGKIRGLIYGSQFGAIAGGVTGLLTSSFTGAILAAIIGMVIGGFITSWGYGELSAIISRWKAEETVADTAKLKYSNGVLK